MVFPQAWQTALCEPAPFVSRTGVLWFWRSQGRHFFLVNGLSGILSTLTTKWEYYRIANSPFKNCPWLLSHDVCLLQAMSASAKQLIKSNFSAVFVSVIRPRYQLFKHPFGNKLEWNFTKENVPVKINEKDHSRPREIQLRTPRRNSVENVSYFCQSSSISSPETIGRSKAPEIDKFGYVIS